MGRIVAQHRPSDSGQPITTRYAYAGLSSTVTDPNGNSSVTTKNLADKPARVVEGNGTSTISYTYDALGNLLKTDTNGQVVDMLYDARGNKAWMKDPTMGSWQYQYNAYGELIWQRDGKGQITAQEYDLLGRMVKRTTAEGIATWEYDTSANGKGKVAAERGLSAETYYTYDKYGRPIATTRKIAGATYTSQLGYDRYSRPAVEVYPDGVQVNRHYTDTGYLQRITLPKKHVWDYDYVTLEQTLTKLTAELVKLHQEASAHEEKYLTYVRKAEAFALTADAWERSSTAAANDAKALRAQADQLQAIANSHQATANHYRQLSSYYWNLLGDRYLSYVSSGNGYANYHGQGACVSRNWKGDCTAYQQFNVSIPASIVPTVCNVNYGWKGASWCSWGPPRSLHIGRFYGERAQEYTNLAAAESAQAQAKNSSAAASERRAADYHRNADSYRQQAQQQYELARKETALLKKVMDKIEDYENASDEIERALDAHNANSDEILLWAATGHDASGRIRGELTGNGLLTRREFDPYSGHLNRITTGIEGQGKLTRDLTYRYDGANNVLSREDAVSGSADNYSYDAFDRLTSAVRTTTSGKGGFQLSYGYDVYGNLTHKSDAGNMTYDPTNNRLQSLDKTNGTQKRYSYDANGNMLQAGDNGVKWTSFNQPLEIRNASTNSTATFLYDTNQQRVQQTNGTTGKSETTTYVSKAFEVTHNDNGVNDRVTQYKHQIYAGDEVVAIQIRTLKNDVKTPDETRYLHKDALGNVDTITDSHGTVIQCLSYDPFGKRTVTSGTDPDRKAWTARGFTGHEHLDNLGLIHMNARLYDPEIGRFISADSYIQAPDKSQNYNRYSYVMNNPLKYTDPSGHFWWIVAAVLFVAAAVTDIPILDTIATIAFAAALGPGASLFGAMLKGAAAGFISGLVSGTNPFKAALWGAISGGVSRFVGHGSASNLDLFANGRHVGTLIPNSPFGAMKWLAHGISQGVITQLRGGNFKSGFVGAVVGDVSGRMSGAAMGALGTSSTVFSRTMVAAVFGGLAAEATGGNFNDGAIAAAFSHLFNNEAAFPTCSAYTTGACAVSAGTVDRNTYGNKAGFTSSLTLGASRTHGAYYGTEQAAQDSWNAIGITLGFVSLAGAGVYVVGVVGGDVLLVGAGGRVIAVSGDMALAHSAVSTASTVINKPEETGYAITRLAIDVTAFYAPITWATAIGASTTAYDTGKYATEKQ